MNSILITGCNRGIGLGLVKELIKQQNAPKHVIATCRNIGKAEELKSLADKNSNIHILEIDLKIFDSYDKLSRDVDSIVGSEGLNVLFNNAAISSKFSRINLVKADQLSDNYLTNTIAPIMLTKALYPALKRASVKNSEAPMGISRAAVLNMSSVLGSISSNTDGGYYPYRCSKAALNMATKSMSADFRTDKILVVSLHPGWVKTNLGGNKAPLEVEESVGDIVKLLATLHEGHNGTFLQHDGEPLNW